MAVSLAIHIKVFSRWMVIFLCAIEIDSLAGFADRYSATRENIHDVSLFDAHMIAREFECQRCMIKEIF